MSDIDPNSATDGRRTDTGAEPDLTLLQARSADVAPNVVVVGDPARARLAAERLDDAHQVGANREYLTYTGTYDGKPVTVASHGVGAAGAAVAFEELCRGGARRIIRCGTAGGLQPDVDDGSLVIAHGAVRGDGLTRGLVPREFPAVADPGLAVALGATAEQTGLTIHRGIVVTSDVFYPHAVMGSDHAAWQRARCVAIEMEVAALLVIAALHGVRAGAILAIDGNPLREEDDDMSGYQPFRDVVRQAVDAALTTALRVAAG